MNYRVEDRFYPEFEKSVEKLSGAMANHANLVCPECGGDMMKILEYREERYMPNGTLENENRYYCDGCGTFADVTQIYKPSERYVFVKQDVYYED